MEHVISWQGKAYSTLGGDLDIIRCECGETFSGGALESVEAAFAKHRKRNKVDVLPKEDI